jgi:aryl-alcohol dehydrogenase-like predicted oxidoreductase
METRRLGTSDLHVSPIGFGAWASGGGGWAFSLGPQDDSESIAAIRRAIDHGVNWIDTAPLYGLGHSEEIVARALTGVADRPYVFTKCGMPVDDGGRIVHSLRRESIRRECEASLRRLRSDVIDLYQIHWNKPSEEIEEGVTAVAELQAEGKVRHIGVSNFTVDEMQAARRIVEFVSLQPPYSLVDRHIEHEILPYCGAADIGVLIYSPMRSGLLSGSMTRERIAAFAKDDVRRSDPEFAEPRLTENLALVKRLERIAGRYGRSPAEIAISWTLHNANVTGAIVGARNPAQVDGVVGAASVKLTRRELDELSREVVGGGDRNRTDE